MEGERGNKSFGPEWREITLLNGYQTARVSVGESNLLSLFFVIFCYFLVISTRLLSCSPSGIGVESVSEIFMCSMYNFRCFSRAVENYNTEMKHLLATMVPSYA